MRLIRKVPNKPKRKVTYGDKALKQNLRKLKRKATK